MTYRIIDHASGRYTLADAAGNLARVTEGSIFTTTDRLYAQRARDFLNCVPGSGGHQLKSMFGRRSDKRLEG